MIPWVLPVAGAEGVVASLNAREFARRAGEPGVVILDVRTTREWNSGHLQGAVHLDISSADFEERLAKLDRKAVYLVYCASGVRSARACQRMQAMGFGQTFNLERGLMAWQAAGLPLQK